MCACNLFFKKCKNEEEVTIINNKHSVLTDEKDTYDEEENKNHNVKKRIHVVMLR